MKQPQNLLCAFRYWLEATPEAIAWIDARQTLSYRDLDAKSGILASKLMAQGGLRGDIIALHLEKGAEMATAILAVLKLGGSYLCVEPHTPGPRLEQLLTDVVPALVLTDSTIHCAVPQATRCLRYCQLPDAKLVSKFPGYRSALRSCACLFYTSGTTGKPKAVAVSHQGILHMAWQPDYVTIVPGQGVGSLSTPAFDAFSFDLWGALSNGAHTVMITPEMLCYQGTDSVLKPVSSVDVLFMTSALFHTLMAGTTSCLGIMSSLLVGGEALRTEAVRQFYRQFSQRPPQLIQVYGPTECSTFATAWPIPADFTGDRLPIGQGIGQTRCWVVTPEGEPVSEGDCGELYLSGPGVALGYYGDEQITRKAFIDCHFSSQPLRCYRTGDKVRWNKDGQLEWLARFDNQVKVRGFRVDLNELEQHILAAPGVEAAVVLTHENGTSIELVVFVSGVAGQLVNFLKPRIPSWMLPHEVHWLPALPLTQNGKIDRRALAVSLQSRQLEERNVSCSGDSLAALRCMLPSEHFSAELSLLDNGGDSLTAMRLLLSWQSPAGQEPVTIAELLHTEPLTAVLAKLQPVSPQSGGIKLDSDLCQVASSEQLRLWFLQQRDPSLCAYSTPFQFELQGPVDAKCLEQALQMLAQRHGAFRTLLEIDVSSQRLMQRVLPRSDFTLQRQHVAESSWMKWAREWFRLPFVLSRDCSLRACLLTVDEDRVMLLLNMHHALIDGESVNIFLHELSQCYSALQRDEQPMLAALNHSLLQHTAALSRYYQQDCYHQSLSFWRERLPEIVAIRQRYGLTPSVDRSGERQQLMIDAQTTQTLKALAKQQKMTLPGLLLSVLGWSWGQWKKQSAITIGFPDAGRFLPGSENLIGMLVNMLVWHEQLSPDDTLGDFLARSGQRIRGIFSHQTVNYADLTDLAAKLQGGGQALFDLAFVMENSDFTHLTLPGITIKGSVPDIGSAKFPFLVCVTSVEMALEVTLEYQTAQFSRDEARFFANQWINLLQQLTHESAVMHNRSIQLPVTAQQHTSVVQHGPQQALSYHSLRAWFDHQSSLTPDAPALVDYDGVTLTYAELIEQVQRMEIFLSQQWGVSYGSVVAIHAHADRHAIIAILAMASRGICFVGLDVNYPDKLITHILTTAGVDAVMVDSAHAASPLLTAQCDMPLIPIDGYLQESGEQPLPAEKAVNADTLLYKVYTSGSTGTPKGLAARHSLMLNIVQWQNRLGLNKPARTLQFTSLSFDISHQEICTTLCTGGTLFLAPPSFSRDHRALLAFLQTRRIQRLFIPYIVLQSLAETAQALEMVPDCFSEIISAGEMLFCTEAIRNLFRRSPGSRLINMYGTSETHVVTSYTLSGDPNDWPTAVPVGYPADNCGVYIVNEAGQLQEDQQLAGQIAITGLHVWPCYQNNPSANQQRFCQLTLNGQPQLAYLTGDIGHYDSQGCLNYLERRDHQVKINGYRVECGQLEALLLDSGYFHSVAVTHQKGVLLAYLRLKSVDTQVTSTDLHQRLQAWMPAGALQLEYRVVDALTTAPSGKIDRAGLTTLSWRPLPDVSPAERPISRLQESRSSAADWRQLLSQLIEKELGREPDSAKTKFFALGLTSLRLIKIHVALVQAGAGRLQLNDLFEHASIDELSHFLAGEPRVQSIREPVAEVFTQAVALAEEMQEIPAGEDAVAVIGMAVNASQCADLSTFWRQVVDSRELMERDSPRGAPDSGDGERKLAVRSSLSGIFDFDPDWFGISPQEAKRMDPQQRHLLMSVVQALENAGYSSREDIGCVGIVASTGDAFYQRWLECRDSTGRQDSDPFKLGLSYQKDFLATKVAYYLGLTGPAFTVQTGCSSSLVAVHQACNALRMGDADMMVVGGVHIDPDLVQGYRWAPGHIFSQRGRCSPFSDKADGTLPANACGVVVLKPLAIAQRDGDRVYAVISGSAINNDGQDKVGYTAPSIVGQAKAITTALARANISAERIGYVETHGTATPLGDPIEISALNRAFSSTTDKIGFCHIASVKSQLGHAGQAAGIIGLIRCALALYHRVLPANVGFEHVNLQLELDKTPFTSSAKSRRWTSEKLRYAGVSSFGMGGTNCHLILHEPLRVECSQQPVEEMEVFLAPFSASTPEALQRLVAQTFSFMCASSLDMATLCARLSLHKPRQVRYLGVWRDRREAAAEMNSWLAQGQDNGMVLRRIEILEKRQELTSLQAQRCRNWLMGSENGWPVSRVSNHPESWAFPATNFAHSPYMLLPAEVPTKLPTHQWRYTPCWQTMEQPCLAVADLCLVVGTLPDNMRLSARRVLVLSLQQDLATQFAKACVTAADKVQILLAPLAGENAVQLLSDLTRVVQAVVQTLPDLTLELNLLTVGALSTAPSERGLPAQAMLASALNVIMQEYAQIHCAQFDCTADSPMWVLGFGLSQYGVVQAWRGKEWLIRSYQPLAEYPLHQLSTLLPSGIYVVLGGSGGIGQALVQAIAAVAPYSRFILVSRCGGERDVEPHLAGRCDYHSLNCDITDLSAVRELAQSLKASYGQIQGILHCAGAPAGALIARHQSADDFTILQEKIRSCEALDILQVLNPRWVICSSSMSAIHGGVGQLSYACANGYLDAWVAAKAQSQQDCCYRVINWDIWQEGGMAVQELPAGLSRQDNRLHLSVGITRQEGAEIFYQAMRAPQIQQLVCTTGLNESRWFYSRRKQQSSSPRPIISEHLAAEGGSLHFIQQLYAEYLGVEEIGSDTSWSATGGDSIQALELLDALNQQALQAVTLSAFMQQDTPEALYRYMTSQVPDSVSCVQQVRKGDLAQVVLLHPIGGDLLAYREILNKLDSRIGIIQIQDPMLCGQLLPDDSLSERAQLYCDQILPLLKDGCPLILMGWSFGALLAYQMAGIPKLQHTAHLVMIDPPAACAWQEVPTDDSQLYAFAQELNYKLSDITPQQVKHLMTGKTVDELKLSPSTQDYVRQLLRAFRRNLTSLGTFIPMACPDVAVSLIYASQSQQAMQFWREQLKTDECIGIEGDHYSILSSEEGERLSRYLNKIISIVSHRHDVVENSI
ncbi:Surfactin synthase subunit 1 [Serratia quinivorans]|uniref:non-ribosomal peptide synthetase n=1 Tax=Serratia quinivorans TaxID=137545 RepID=UPI00217847BF|nr:non-ribosomal peptide synthetase [Serratia quinivorans]CAI1519821.1 Surfactin synthase subunit 1 [Serratia quinivorans]